MFISIHWLSGHAMEVQTCTIRQRPRQKIWGNHMAGPLVGLTMLGTAILRTHFAGRERYFFRGPSLNAPSTGRESRMVAGFTLPSGYVKIAIENGPLK